MKDEIAGLEISYDSSEGEYCVLRNKTPRDFIVLDMDKMGDVLQLIHTIGQWIATKKKDEMERNQRSELNKGVHEARNVGLVK